MAEKSVRELLLEKALMEIIEGAPIEEPPLMTSFESDRQIEEYGYKTARWRDAKIARKALGIKSE